MGDENAEVTIEVIKSGANVGDLYINVAPLTYAQLESMAIPIPPDVPGPQTRPDPAECKYLLQLTHTIMFCVIG